MTEQLLTPREAADLLAVSPGTVRNWAYQRKLPVVKIGSTLRFRRAALERLIQQSERRAIR